ncbi:MAG: Na+/H+ antiporter NhaA [Lewinella sp.]|nr:Na+/H+ antiporter NhaA [Lewinella sp.]
MWYCFLKGGVHPTVAGILAAQAIPTNIKLRMTPFVEETKRALNFFLDAKANAVEQFLAKGQQRAISEIERNADLVQPLLQRLEQQLNPYVTFLILPAFALANTMSLFIGGLAFADEQLLNQAKLGILLGSVLAGSIGYGILRFSFRRRCPPTKRPFGKAWRAGLRGYRGWRWRGYRPRRSARPPGPGYHRARRPLHYP